MFRKSHVSKFIKQIMDVKAIKKSDFYSNWPISRQTVENILEKEGNLSYENALIFSKVLGVSPEMLVNLNLIYIKYLKEIDAKEKFKKELKKTKNNLEGFDIDLLDFLDFDFFINHKTQYFKNIVHYEPTKANKAKEWLFVSQLNNLEDSVHEFDYIKFSNYLNKEYLENLNKIKNNKDFYIFIKTLKETINNLGISLKIISTQLNTTCKAITLLDEKIKIIVEFEEDIPNIIWKITHEFMHVIYEYQNNDKIQPNDFEGHINKLVANLLLGDLGNYYDIPEDMLETLLAKTNVPLMKGMIFKNYWGFINKKNNKYKNQMTGDKNDILQLFL